MSRFSNSNFRSLNESIQNLNSTNRITELEQYVDMLESVLISIAEEMECGTDELVEMAQTPARAEETKRLRIKARKAAKVAADKLDAIRDMEWNEKKLPDLYGLKGKKMKPTKKMLKTRAATEKAKKTKYANAVKKDQEFEDARKETERKNMQTPLGRAIARASYARSSSTSEFDKHKYD
jgi:hypothetical protein